MAVVNPQVRAAPLVMQRTNLAIVLDCIRRNQGVSRAELATMIGLTAAAVSKIVAELLGLNLVLEAGEHSTGSGRPRTRLIINPQARYAIGVDLVRSGVRAALVDLSGQIRESVTITPEVHVPPQVVTVEQVLEAISLLLERVMDSWTKILGIGIGAPGPLNVRDGVILSPPAFTGWENVQLKQIVEERFRIPVWLDNDANACALAEGWFGAGQQHRHFVYLAAGTGVGSGLIINGEIYRGANDIAGEFGHTTIEAAGPRCICGNYGCLELYTSTPALISAALAALYRGEQSQMSTMLEGRWQDLTVAIIAQAARQHDLLAVRLIEQVARYMGVGVVNAINLFDPEVVFLGRELARDAGDLLLPPIQKMVAERAFTVAANRVQIRLATLHDDAPVIGAACIVFQAWFTHPEKQLTPLTA